jgi:hypothetical protein
MHTLSYRGAKGTGATPNKEPIVIEEFPDELISLEPTEVPEVPPTGEGGWGGHDGGDGGRPGLGDARPGLGEGSLPQSGTSGASGQASAPTAGGSGGSPFVPQVPPSGSSRGLPLAPQHASRFVGPPQRAFDYFSARDKYRNGGGGDVLIDIHTLDFSGLENSGWSQEGTKTFTFKSIDFLVHGTVTVRKTGPNHFSVDPETYNNDLKPGLSIRNVLTFGNRLAHGRGSPFRFVFVGERRFDDLD